ncbi:MAG: hypothetical protein FWF81_02025 [Defluviitaleaceae bacterium]|nr:hypothetical protein [Defluviitaleaceae bacterium]
MDKTRKLIFNVNLLFEYIKPKILVLCLFILIMYLILPGVLQISFASLPRGARNGSWAYAAIESNHPRFFNDIYTLAEESTLVLRVEVADERIEVFGRGRPERLIWEQFYVYSLEVVEAYNGFLSERFTIEKGDVLEILQLRGLSKNRNAYWPRINDSNMHYYFCFIPSNINIGDELVVFLSIIDHAFSDTHPNSSLTHFSRLLHKHESVRGRRVLGGEISRDAVAHRMGLGISTPTPSRFFSLTNQVQAAYVYNSNDYIFESVNPHNNLILTREDLKYIRERKEIKLQYCAGFLS